LYQRDGSGELGEDVSRHPAPVVALVGPTASGKSDIALDVALRSGGPGRTDCRELGVEVVSIDSMAVYRGMDIGTAKPTSQRRGRVRFHLVDLVDPSEEFTVLQFQQAARRSMADIARRRHGTLLVGGTGLYLRSVVDGLSFPGRFPAVAADLAAGLEAAGPPGSPGERSALAALHRQLIRLDAVAAGRIEPTNRRRLLRALEVTIGSGKPFSSFGPGLERYPPSAVVHVGIRHDPAVLDRRIADRFGRWMDLGFLEEVRSLRERPGGVSRTARQALGYRELLAHLEDGLPLTDAVDQAIRRTRAFARRQMAWFRRDPRIVWMTTDDDPVGWIEARLGPASPGPAAVGE
jgi:tRNA dimethylallyltransferase